MVHTRSPSPEQKSQIHYPVHVRHHVDVPGHGTQLHTCPLSGSLFHAPFASRIKNPLLLALAFSFGEALQLCISPELGFAFASGACFYAICMTAKHGRAWISAIVAPLLGAGVFLWVAGPHYLDSVRYYSHGDLNLIVEPLGYIILFLIAAVWLVPRMLAGAFRQRRPEAVLLASLFVVCLVLLPPALGRCDPLHVFFNGAGMFVLASVAIGAYSGDVRKLWFFCFACSLMWMQFVNFMLRPDVKRAFGFDRGSAPQNWIDMSQLEPIVGDAKISVPFRVPLGVENELKQSGHFLPDRESFNLLVTNPDAEKARTARMDRAQWALIPAKDFHLQGNPIEHIANVRNWLRVLSEASRTVRVRCHSVQRTPNTLDPRRHSRGLDCLSPERPPVRENQ